MTTIEALLEQLRALEKEESSISVADSGIYSQANMKRLNFSLQAVRLSSPGVNTGAFRRDLVNSGSWPRQGNIGAHGEPCNFVCKSSTLRSMDCRSCSIKAPAWLSAWMRHT